MTASHYTIGMVQIGDAFGDQHYLPYAAGMIESYARKNVTFPERFTFLPCIYKRDKINDVAQALERADCIGISCYLWNQNLTLAIAKRIKELQPRTVIVAGGPQIPARTDLLEIWCREHPYIDIAIHGEGEVSFTQVLEALDERNFELVQSAGIFQAGCFTATKSADRITDLDTIPSPYCSGVFDALCAHYPHERWNGLIETNRGCPFTCAYCYWGDPQSRKVFKRSMATVQQEIDWCARHSVEFIFCCDANFGMLERDLDIAEYVALTKRATGYPHAFSVQNTKNTTQRIFDLQKKLNDAGLQRGVNIALQSTNPQTLENIHRSNISNDSFRDLQHMFALAHIPTFTDIIMGLPGETYHSFVQGVSGLIADGQHNRIQFINLTILENTAMALPEYQEQHGLILQEADIVSHHGSLSDSPEVVERQKLVIGTKTLPIEAWKATRIFAWMTSLLYFNKVIQIPIMVAMAVTGKSFAEIFAVFVDPPESAPALRSLCNFFALHAQSITEGSTEYAGSLEYCNVYWPADELAFIQLCTAKNGLLEALIAEAQELLFKYMNGTYADMIEDACILNCTLIHGPGKNEDCILNLRYDIPAFWHETTEGKKNVPEQHSCRYKILRSKEKEYSTDDWCRDIVWYGTKRGAYLYSLEKERVLNGVLR